jgi:hypothetical protein
MPNWVSQILTVVPKHRGKEILDAIKETVTEGDKSWETAFDFNKVIPMPAHQPDLDKPNAFYAEGGVTAEEEHTYGSANTWYHWSVKNWGTKWNACGTKRINDHQLCYSTAWAVPVPILIALSKKYPDVGFKINYYIEGGWGKGTIKLVNGDMYENVRGTYVMKTDTSGLSS